jgi:tRNA threonylcarbamoyl adenosine modification protein YeaZ
LQFNTGFDAIFNVPDMCVVGGTSLFVVSVIVCVIFDLVNETKINKNKPINFFIDTTQKKCNMSIFQDNKNIYSKSIVTNNNLTDLVIEYIKKVCVKVKIKPEQINNFYLTTGPGSFTGNRIGTIIAKTWVSIGESINFYTIDSNYLQTKGNDISILDAKGSKYYVGIYKNNKLVGKVKILSIDEIELIKNKSKLDVSKDFEGIDIFKQLFFHIKDFKKVD